jgi:hypothetical protein
MIGGIVRRTEDERDGAAKAQDAYAERKVREKVVKEKS